MFDNPSFAEFKQMIASLGPALGDADDRLMRQVLDIDDEATAKQFLIAHIDDFGPVLRAAILEGVVNEVENSIEKDKLKSEAHVLLDAAYKDVKWLADTIGEEDMKEMTPTLTAGFINEYLGRSHSVMAIKAALNGLNIWYRGE